MSEMLVEQKKAKSTTDPGVSAIQKSHEVFLKQKAFYNSNKTLEASFRIKQLTKLLRVLEENEDYLYEEIYKDFQKSKFDTFLSEIGMIKSDIKFYIKNIDKWTKRSLVPTNLANLPALSYTQYEPLGTTFVIGAWNYPYQLTLCPMIASMAAGNVTLVKPSGTAKHTSAAMAKLINENFDEEYLYVVEGRGQIVEGIMENSFDKVFFTGSPRVGRQIMALCARNLTNVTLELGGKSPAIFTKEGISDVNLKRFIWGKFLNAGQTCIAPDYVLVPKEQEELFLKKAKEQIKEVIGDYKTSDFFCQIATERHLKRFADILEKDRAKIYSGGEVNLEARMLEPTILRGVTLDDEIMKEEIFGPILPVLTYTSIEEAIELVKKFPKPLSFHYYVGNNGKVKRKLIKEIPSGSGCINDSLVFMANHNLPFGGVGNSGQGKYHGKAGYEDFSNIKGIMERPTWFEPPIKYMPYTSFKQWVISKLF